MKANEGKKSFSRSLQRQNDDAKDRDAISDDGCHLTPIAGAGKPFLWNDHDDLS
jgi:hypothetical protein